MLVTIEWMRRKYDEFNAKYWGGQLPSISFKINNSRKTFGFASYTYNTLTNKVIPNSITMSNYFDSDEHWKENTMLHEMVHIADYTFNPHHFVRYGRKVSKRSYDAHGPLFFLKEAARINQDGYIIQKYVSGEEHNASVASEKNRAREEKRMREGYYMVFLHNPEYWFMVKTNDKGIAYIGNYVERSSYWDGYEVYKCFDPYWMNVKNQVSRIRGWQKNDKEKADDIQKYNMQFVDRVGKLGINRPIERPKRMIFRMPLKSGGELEIKTDDKSVIIPTLQRRFPNFSQEAIEKIVGNPRFYVEENKVTMKKKLNENIEDTMKTVDATQPMEMTQRLSDTEFMVSIA